MTRAFSFLFVGALFLAAAFFRAAPDAVQRRLLVSRATGLTHGMSQREHAADLAAGVEIEATVESHAHRLVGGRVAEFFGELRSLPNQLTALRLVIIAALWGFALTGRSVVVGVGLGLAFLTDVADGHAARRMQRVSGFGSKFDSIVDSTIGPSAFIWVLLLYPAVVTDHLFLAGVWIVTTYTSLAVGLVRHRRIANLHLQSSRIACVAQYAFLVDVFVASSYSPMLLYVAAGLGIYASVETLILQFSFDDVSDHERSFVHALRQRRWT